MQPCFSSCVNPFGQNLHTGWWSSTEHGASPQASLHGSLHWKFMHAKFWGHPLSLKHIDTVGWQSSTHIQWARCSITLHCFPLSQTGCLDAKQGFTHLESRQAAFEGHCSSLVHSACSGAHVNSPLSLRANPLRHTQTGIWFRTSHFWFLLQFWYPRHGFRHWFVFKSQANFNGQGFDSEQFMLTSAVGLQVGSSLQDERGWPT